MRPRSRKISSTDNRKKGHRSLKLFALLLMCSLLWAGLYFAGHGSLFQLQEVVVYGNKYLSEEEVKAFMGVGGGENLFNLSLAGLALRLSGSPWIKSVSLRKEYPRRLLVKIEEAAPVALLERRERFFLLDGEGKILEMLSEHSVPFLPVIVSEHGRGSETFMEALSLAKVIKRAGLSQERECIEITGVEGRPEDLMLNVDGLVVKVGWGQYEDKLSKLFELSDEIQKRGIDVDYVDLRFANRVVVKPLVEVLR